ncbi:MAG TPA: TonB-dependent receptor [Oscillatoriaceae cyanobacterium M7585_C2015_266]|nr:TonB-dependent receptor [Oscillatoriaceae cyanobacterium M7585_C2015_266]
MELRVNGEIVDPKLIGRTEVDTSTGMTTQIWYGVPLKEGENKLSVSDEKEITETVTIFVVGAPAQIKVETVETRIPADGRSTATVRGELLDERGNRSNRDAIVTLTTSAGKFIGEDEEPAQPGFQVKATRGLFSATLQSGIEAGRVRIRAATQNPKPKAPNFNFQLEAFTQLEFETNLRPSLATGVIDLRFGRRSTNFWGSFQEFLPADGDNKYELNIRGGTFATGAIGEWLFTGAYSSDRTLNQSCEGFNSRLFRDVQFYEQTYPIYGDNCSRETVTPSRDSLYLRFERSPSLLGAEPDYFMWGDYGMAEFTRTSQEFTGISRSLHGFKANYNLGNFQITGFYSPDIEGFQRDTIIPDGTSGYYFLSRRLIIPGSENIFIEAEDFDRPGTVLYRQQVIRGTDYEIDYDRGTLLFRRPILRIDIDPSGTVLMRRIVATYQFEGKGRDTNIYGGRIQYHLSRNYDNSSWIGATYWRENQGVRDFELYGADAFISFGKYGELIAEYAHSNNESEILGFVSGNAYRFELNGRLGTDFTGRLYYRSTDTGFSNTATTSFVPGQTRYGALALAKVSPTTQLRFQYDFERNEGIAPRQLTSFADLFEPRFEPLPGSRVDNSLRTISAGLIQQIGEDVTLEFDYINRYREDNRPINKLRTNSSQLRSRLTYQLTDTLTFRAQNELNLSSKQDLVYPDRTILALDWAVSPGIAVRLSHIFFSGSQFKSDSITSLDFFGDYKLGEDTTLTGRFGMVNAQAMTGAVGIRQGWTLAPGLRLDASYERIFGDLFGKTGAGVRFAQPYAYGRGASALGVRGGDNFSIGLQYTGSPDFQASARLEHRTSSAGSNTVISATANGKISRALTALARFTQASSSNQLLEDLGNTVNLRIGLAYRDPDSDKFNALLRYEYRNNPSTTPDTILFDNGTGYKDHTFALEAIYAPNWRWEFYGKAALRNSTSFFADDLVGSSTVTLAQARATYRLGYQWDLVGEARWISQPADGYDETGFALEAGYYLTPNLRLAAGYAFGNVSDRDFDNSRNSSGAYLGLTVKLNELFSGFGLQKPIPAPPQESKVNPETPLKLSIQHSQLSQQYASGGEKKWK